MENHTINQTAQAKSALADPTKKPYQSTQKDFTDEQSLSNEEEFLTDISNQDNASNDIDSLEQGSDFNEFSVDNNAEISDADSSWGDSADLVDGSTLEENKNESADDVISHLDNGTEITRGGLGSALRTRRDSDQDEDVKSGLVKSRNTQPGTAI